MQKDVKCTQCGTLFGKEITTPTSQDSLLTIKNRDLYRTFKAGDSGYVMGPCRGCGATISWPKDSR